jgi:2-octaprenyl-6-methoxyphenol hydroxylase
MKKTNYDCVIVGGGMVGISFALMLARQCVDMRVLLLESKPDISTQQNEECIFDARTTALSFKSALILEDIDVWTLLRKQLAEIASIHVSTLGHFGVTRINSSDIKVEALGYVVENHTMRTIFAEKLAQSNISSRFSSKIAKVELHERALELVLEDGGSAISTQLLIIADGAASETAQQVGIHARVRDHQQSAIVANLTLEKEHRGAAYERFIRGGSIALLPMSPYLGKPRASLVWIQSNDETKTMMRANDASFLVRLQDQFGHRAGLFSAVGVRRNYALASAEAEEQARRRVVLLGNAAHSLHPIAGQGFNLALRDAECLSSCIREALDKGLDYSSMEVLGKYLDSRWFDQQKVIGFTKFLPQLFATDSYPVGLGRNLALLFMESSQPFRRAFARFGMGL